MKQIALGLMLLLLCTAVSAQNGEKNFIDQNYIEVTGESEMEIIPDMIYIKVLLNEKDTKNKISITELESKMIDRLKSTGIDVAKDLLVKDMSSNFKNYFLKKDEVLLSKEYQILAHSGKQASLVFIGLEKEGISNVSIDRVENSKIVQYRKEARVNAIKAAREKADYLGTAINQSIGKALYVQELDRMSDFKKAPNSFMIRGVSTLGISSSTEVPDIEFEKLKIECSVLCRFELK